MATPDELALLRTMVEGDFERHEELAHSLRDSGSLANYGTVIGAAFLLAVRRQFPQRWCTEDVIRLVADARAMFDQTGEVLDPRAAELVVRSALGEHGRLSGIPGATKVEAQVLICSYLAHEGKLGDADTFMGEVKKLLDDWGE